MKNYKLIKEYPGSPELGHIVNDICFVQIFCENYPEFWQEVKEYDFEILKISSKKENNIYKEGTIITFLDTEEPFDEGWQKWWNIYSIRRKSDGETK